MIGLSSAFHLVCVMNHWNIDFHELFYTGIGGFYSDTMDGIRDSHLLLHVTSAQLGHMNFMRDGFSLLDNLSEKNGDDDTDYDLYFGVNKLSLLGSETSSRGSSLSIIGV